MWVKATLLSAVTLTPITGTDSSAAFEQLKRLQGTWDVTEKGNPALSETATYRMTGRGTVLVEDLRGASAMGHMLTTYHLDEGQLVLTHFCGAGNQPRMRLKSVEEGGRRILFEIYDITNLASPDAYHSIALEVVFLNDERVDLAYRGKSGGEESVQLFQLSRTKPTAGF
jgi:hypothetical protein